MLFGNQLAHVRNSPRVSAEDEQQGHARASTAIGRLNYRWTQCVNLSRVAA